MAKKSAANGRILALDYGSKYTGLAVTDPLKIIAQGLDTVDTPHLLKFLDGYVKHTPVSMIVLGLPKNLDNSSTHNTLPVQNFYKKLVNRFGNISIVLHDERYTSKMAVQAMVLGGKNKQYRRSKIHINRISATLILQSFLDQLSQGRKPL